MLAISSLLVAATKPFNKAHLVQILVGDQCKAELRTAPNDTRWPALEECLKAFFPI